jgi:ABC-type dipeptide/oligopeptide/nickel transport system permease subunit
MKTTLAKLWLGFFAITIIIAASFSPEIEAHNLPRTLKFGFDAFGRSCILLSLDAAYQSFLTIIPIGFFCMILAFLASLIKTAPNPALQFTWSTFVDTLSSLPGFLIALSLSVFLGGQFYTVLLASVFMVLPYLIRFFESQIVHLQSQEYITSAGALGGTRFHIFKWHLFPELARSMLSIFPFLMTRLLVTETSLSFLGLSSDSSRETWGKLLYQGKDYLLEAPWICLFSGLPLFLTLLAFHLLSKRE